ncbi:immunity protein Imm33 domain-containing protein [Priestia megaterium]|uniref:immunity protein Imm33 domain-containing protein n=1 Tax=Priestia megaterium TaxID=1404 RepID=UPI00196AD5B9|nr:hypothetical protein [Priestia megaterium]QSF36718.1 hypothetical protein ICR96_14590 [Priestia megaterium]
MKKFIRNIGDKVVVIQAENELEMQVENLFSIFETIETEKWVEGFSIQIGWSRFIVSIKGKEYHILSPDYSKNPFEDDTEDLTLALWVQLEQVHFLRKLNINNGETVRFSDKVVVAKNILEVDSIYLQRSSNCEQGDSGWYIGAVNEEDDTEELEAFYAYQLLKIRPSLIQVLALPYEYMAVFEKDEVQAVLNENDEDVFN